MAQEFGGRPEDRIRDDEGDTLTRITVEFYPSQADVQFKTNSRGTTFVPANGLWTFTDPDLAELWIAPVGGPYFAPYQVRSKTYLSATFTRRHALSALAAKLRAAQSATVAIAGDSTSDETAEWWRRLWDSWVADHPQYTMVYRAWDDASQAYVDTTTQTGGVKARTAADTFNRTAADLVGSASPRGGAAWAGAAGAFSLNGSRASWVASTGYVTLAGTVTGAKKVLTGTVNITGGTSAAFRRINLGMYKANTNVERISLRLKVNTDGSATFGVDGQFPAYSGVIADGAYTLPAAATELPFSLTIDGDNVTATLGATTITGTLTAGQRTSVDGMNSLYIMPEGTLTGLTVDNMTLDVYDTSSAPTLTVINGSKAGSNLTYQQARLAAMFPGSIDALWVSSCHNYGGTTATDYLTAVDAFLAAYLAQHPESAIAVVAQNPEAPPASNRASHRSRAAAVRGYAADKGYALVDFLRVFDNYPNWQAVLLRTDGVHPTAASTYDDATDPVNGAYQMMTEARAVLSAAGA